MAPLCSREGHFTLPAQSFEQCPYTRVPNGHHLKRQLQYVGSGCLAPKGCWDQFALYAETHRGPVVVPVVNSSPKAFPFPCSNQETG